MDNLGRSDQRVYCCLYEYLPPRNTTLTIIFTDLGLEQEKLRGFLLQKIEEGPLGRDGILGLVTSIQAAQIDPTATVPHPTCFYRTLGGEDNKHYIICLVAAVKPEELSLFLPDLQLFVESVEEILLDPNFSSSAERDTKLQDYLPSWWWLSVDYLIRAILLLGKELPPMLHAASIGKQILVKPHKHAEDISRFADTIRSGLPQSQTQDEELETVIVTLSNADGLPGSSLPMLSTNQTNPFCNSWAQQLRSGHNFNALQLKKAINEKKHKVANELIQVQKLITDAKYDNYCLYVVHAKLARNKNQDILLKLLGRDTTNDEAAAQVVLLLEGFRKEGLMAK